MPEQRNIPNRTEDVLLRQNSGDKSVGAGVEEATLVRTGLIINRDPVEVFDFLRSTNIWLLWNATLVLKWAKSPPSSSRICAPACDTSTPSEWFALFEPALPLHWKITRIESPRLLSAATELSKGGVLTLSNTISPYNGQSLLERKLTYTGCCVFQQFLMRVATNQHFCTEFQLALEFLKSVLEL